MNEEDYDARRKWTQAKKQRVIELHNEGLSHSASAAQVGATTHATTGMIHRLQARGLLPKRDQPIKPKNPDKKKPRSLPRATALGTKMGHLPTPMANTLPPLPSELQKNLTTRAQK